MKRHERNSGYFFFKSAMEIFDNLILFKMAASSNFVDGINGI